MNTDMNDAEDARVIKHCPKCNSSFVSESYNDEDTYILTCSDCGNVEIMLF